MIIQGTCDSFRTGLLTGVHVFGTDTIKVALYQNGSANLIPSQTTIYSTAGELSSTGYAAGGQTLTGVTVNLASGVGYVTWNAPSWTLPLIPGVDGALIYNSSKSNSAICILNFGVSRYPLNSGVFTLAQPYDPINNAIIRLA